jgi:hypothetical protein
MNKIIFMSLCVLTAIQIKAADGHKKAESTPRSTIKRAPEHPAPINTGIYRSPNIQQILQEDPEVIKRAVREYKEDLRAQRRKSI